MKKRNIHLVKYPENIFGVFSLAWKLVFYRYKACRIENYIVITKEIQ